MKHLLLKCCIVLCFVGFTNYSLLHAQSGAWLQLGLDIDGEAAGDQFGSSVAFSSDGNRVAIGAPHANTNNSGHVRVYDWDGAAWTQVGADIDGENPNDASGWAVALSAAGSRLAIGAINNEGNGGIFSYSGHVRVYDWNGSAWTQVGADINGEASDSSGSSVALSDNGSRVAIGAPYNDDNGNNVGQVRVFDWDGSTWTQVGADINGEATTNDLSGYAIDLSASGNRLAVGAIHNDGTSNNTGSVRVYDWDGAAWVQVGTDIDGKAEFDNSGWSVALSSNGNRLAIGAPPNDDNGQDSGHVRVYDWDGSTWIQVGTDIAGEAAGDHSGWSVSLSADGSRLAIGARNNDGNGADAGQVRVYIWNGSTWVQIGADIDGEATGDWSGYAVALSAAGSRVAIGAKFNDGNGADAGQVRVFEFQPACEANKGTWGN